MLLTTEAGPKITAQDVEAIERRYSLHLPDEYREFLMIRNGGRPERDLFFVHGCEENPVARVHFFFGINDPIESCNLTWNIDVFGARLGMDLIPIATTEGADKICMVADSGAIVYWDGYRDVTYPVSDSFKEFIGSLFRDEASPRIVPA